MKLTENEKKKEKKTRGKAKKTKQKTIDGRFPKKGNCSRVQDWCSSTQRAERAKSKINKKRKKNILKFRSRAKSYSEGIFQSETGFSKLGSLPVCSGSRVKVRRFSLPLG